ncbi:MAG: NYN domain-containing protein [Candidatus Sumerlaeia bacterium]
MKKTYTYIDGFNLYYGAIKGTPYKWLNLHSLLARKFPKNHIACIKYFTAIVKSPPWDKNKSNRQMLYLKALTSYIPNFRYYKGFFLEKPVKMPLANEKQEGGRMKMVEVIKTEEKGSDVNLAVHLLNDAWKKEYEAAIVVSNDSDLAESIRLVKQEHGLPIGILNPHIHGKSKASVQLKQAADFHGTLTMRDLEYAQLPERIPGTKYMKPQEW